MADGEASHRGLSEQQERFCRFLVEGMNQNEAYVAAGYKVSNDATARANASRLLTNASIQNRLAELRKPATEKAEVTLEWLIEQAKDILEAAKRDGSHAAGIAAVKELGVLSGKRVETRHNLNQDVNDTSELSRADLLNIARAGRQGTSEAGSGQGKPDRVHPVH